MLRFLVLMLLAGPALAQTLAAVPPAPHSALKTYALRLRPGDDSRQQLITFVQAHHILAGTMLTCVGSLTVVTLRLANQEARCASLPGPMPANTSTATSLL